MRPRRMSRQQIGGWIDAFRSHSAATVIMQVLEQPPYAADGIARCVLAGAGQRRAIDAANAVIAAIAAPATAASSCSTTTRWSHGMAGWPGRIRTRISRCACRCGRRRISGSGRTNTCASFSARAEDLQGAGGRSRQHPVGRRDRRRRSRPGFALASTTRARRTSRCSGS